MPYDQSRTADVELIIVTDDRAHALSVRESLSNGRYRYAFTHLSQSATAVSDLDAAVEAVRGNRPVIVFLDCAFFKGQAETFAARVLELRSTMAIECVATRPPPNITAEFACVCWARPCSMATRERPRSSRSIELRRWRRRSGRLTQARGCPKQRQPR
jgi:hypothetical protein